MPSSACCVLDEIGLSVGGRIRWGEEVPSSMPGVYVVSLSHDPTANFGCLAEAPISLPAVEGWLAIVPSLSLDGVVQPPADRLADFLNSFWLPDEDIVYIGKATRLRSRLSQLFRHRLGDRRPHAGGHWVKTLACLQKLHVYFSECESVEQAAAKETSALDAFVVRVSKETRALLPAPHLAIPFANREHPHGNRKQKRLSHDVVLP